MRANLNPLQALLLDLIEERLLPLREVYTRADASEAEQYRAKPIFLEDVEDAVLANWARELMQALVEESKLAPEAEDDDAKVLSHQSLIILRLAFLIDDLPRTWTSEAAVESSFDTLLGASTRLTEEWVKRTKRAMLPEEEGLQFKQHSMALKLFRQTAATIALVIAFADPKKGVKGACRKVAEMSNAAGYREILVSRKDVAPETVRSWVKVEFPSKEDRDSAVRAYVMGWFVPQFESWSIRYGPNYFFHMDIAEGRVTPDDLAENEREGGPLSPPVDPIDTIVGNWRNLTGAYARTHLSRLMADVRVEKSTW